MDRYPISTDSKFNSIVLRIHDLIEEDNLSPGEKLPSERELVSRLQVGRSTVREALRALELLGIITTRRGEGTYLQPYESHRLVDLLAFYILRDEPTKQHLSEMRTLLETGAARQAALRGTIEDWDALEGICLEMAKKISQGDIPFEEDFRFHRRLVKASHNHLLLRVWYPVVQYGQAMRQSALTREGRVYKALEQHREIVTYLRHGNADAAATAVEKHLTEAGFPLV
ncbi:FadR/GntR family transcriptional regulator [Marininema halotolerans]|uniref:GntR family transcriptional regulator, transcriptional repressor for pyruvate dehydrogenase complex n=1 Tax=Marininema halotolerans TaxID=1155944 RepID=A0A1I6S2V8_9BACL|nr:FadR/GntR family transcriptional regulator [Marininema halotolerans]SFS71303.1 GntR family transcriptional regulator, transcriptional repressor for pyruvate dehydrogenase complex [Marininema halotolerans]